MTHTWNTWGHVIVAGLLSIPLAALSAFLLTRFRSRQGHPTPTRTALADVGIVVGTAPWIWMILTPSAGRNGVNLIPFRDLTWVTEAPAGTVFTQVGGNLLVFFALGALLPVRSARFASLTRVAAVAATASTSVEILQYALRLGRFSSVDDVLINTVGAVLAAMITRRWWAPEYRLGPFHHIGRNKLR
ncbi:VanZ family protein [Nonomuraea sp. NPDC046570]|uniref:VanZ family protein n=1 Tax=Nonomuraea sp. NPDC046570 TaxID=3155255 RepID=UPI0033C481E6